MRSGGSHKSSPIDPKLHNLIRGQARLSRLLVVDSRCLPNVDLLGDRVRRKCSRHSHFVLPVSSSRVQVN